MSRLVVTLASHCERRASRSAASAPSSQMIINSHVRPRCRAQRCYEVNGVESCVATCLTLVRLDARRRQTCVTARIESTDRGERGKGRTKGKKRRRRQERGRRTRLKRRMEFAANGASCTLRARKRDYSCRISAARKPALRHYSASTRVGGNCDCRKGKLSSQFRYICFGIFILLRSHRPGNAHTRSAALFCFREPCYLCSFHFALIMQPVRERRLAFCRSFKSNHATVTNALRNSADRCPRNW